MSSHTMSSTSVLKNNLFLISFICELPAESSTQSKIGDVFFAPPFCILSISSSPTIPEARIILGYYLFYILKLVRKRGNAFISGIRSVIGMFESAGCFMQLKNGVNTIRQLIKVFPCDKDIE